MSCYFNEFTFHMLRLCKHIEMDLKVHRMRKQLYSRHSISESALSLIQRHLFF